MASYAQNPAQVGLAKNQISVLAQAKPAIISEAPSQSQSYCSGGITTCSTLSEKLDAALKLSHQAQSNSSSHQRENSIRFDYEPKVRHIEDDAVLEKQNASNQMRQAAVMAAVASQQKVRLSATERLAMTAKRPIPTQQLHSKQPSMPIMGSKPPVPNSKPAPMPTLETLLAVQRQLQQHTMQNLNSAPQKLVNKQDSAGPPQRLAAPNTKLGGPAISQSCDKPLPPSPPKSPYSTKPAHTVGPDLPVVTYEKDLPPLPPSISPSDTTDDSQPNSIDSHQSSPATSLVSIPPPPPPISSYLEQYDEVTGCHPGSLHSNSSSPSTTGSSEVSSVRNLSTHTVYMNLAQQPAESAHKQHPQNLELPLPYKTQANFTQMQMRSEDSRPPLLAPKPKQLQALSNQRPVDLQLTQPQLQSGANSVSQMSGQHPSYQQQMLCMQPPPPLVNEAKISAQPTVAPIRDQPPPPSFQVPPQNYLGHKPQINYQQHMFNPAQTSLSSAPFKILPPPPQTANTARPQPATTSASLTAQTLNDASNVGFDEPDSGSFRFPTPPPPDLLLEDEHNLEDDCDDYGEDDDFQCKIPTPPPHKSMSVASFPDLTRHLPGQQSLQHGCMQQQPQQPNRFDHIDGPSPKSVAESSSPVFNASTFAATNAPQPPPLFRQDSQQMPTPPLVSAALPAPPLPPQLTVHINNETSGLLSTANPNLHHGSQLLNRHPLNNHHQNNHHHIMMTMAASSSSPSSSSDGDGHSSNSSSSTSGIHSSIESPSSSNDFNYSASCNKLNQLKKPAALLATKRILTSNYPTSQHQSHQKQQQQQQEQQQQQQQQRFPQLTKTSVSTVTTATTTTASIVGATAANKTGAPTSTMSGAAVRRPALKQKKTVSFSDKVELVACADEQSEIHLPNPLLARVLAGKLQ